MRDCKPLATPLCTSENLKLEAGELLGPSDATNYRSVVGALQYLTLTRPDISHSVNKVCEFLNPPISAHWKVVNRIPRYLKFTSTLGLKICNSPSMLVSAFLMQIGQGVVVKEGQLVALLHF